MNSLLKWKLGGAIRKTGLGVYRAGSIGHDPFHDVQQLSMRWNRPIDVFFDVGANDGGTAQKARHTFPSARIFAFEPHPITFAALQANTAHLGNVSLHQLALGSETTEAEMFEFDLSTVNSLVPDANYARRFPSDPRRVKVQCSTLDGFCADLQIENIDVLKIDTEGFDLQVLKGASASLHRGSIHFVLVEFNDIHTQNESGALAPIDNLLRESGLRFIATYNDYIVTEGEFFGVSNALFARPPSGNY